MTRSCRRSSATCATRPPTACRRTSGTAASATSTSTTARASSNLAFCLLSTGGTHPRGKTTVNVPGDRHGEGDPRSSTRRNVDILTSSSNFAALRTATEQAATQLGFDAATGDAVGCAWAAVGVGTRLVAARRRRRPVTACSTNNVPVTGLADSTVGNMKFWKLDVPAGQSTPDVHDQRRQRRRGSVRPVGLEADDGGLSVPAVPQRQLRDLHVHAPVCGHLLGRCSTPTPRTSGVDAQGRLLGRRRRRTRTSATGSA